MLIRSTIVKIGHHSCLVKTAPEREWLTNRQKRSSYWCRAGLGDLPRFLYTLGGGKCESLGFTDVLKALRDSAETMTDKHNLIKILNGKIVYLIKTTDLVNSKLSQVISSLWLVAGAFRGWKEHFNSLETKESCHFNMQQ